LPIGSRREQEHTNLGEGNRQCAVRPLGDDPEELDGTNGDESAPGTDQSRKPVRHAGQNAVTARYRPSRIANEQRQPIERVATAGEHFGRLIGKQPQRRCACR